jgi:hypothetical protein
MASPAWPPPMITVSIRSGIRAPDPCQSKPLATWSCASNASFSGGAEQREVPAAASGS